MSDKKKAPLPRFLLYFATVAFPTVVAYYLGIWFGMWSGDLDLKYYRETMIRAEKGLTVVDPDGALELKVQEVLYKKQVFDSLCLANFTLINGDWQNLRQGAEFYFRGDGEPLSSKDILDVTCSTSTATGDVVHMKRIDDPDLGPGLHLESDLPGHAQVRITLVLDTSRPDSALESSIDQLALVKKYRGHERLSLGTHPSETMVTIPFWNGIIWLIAAAFVYGGSWLTLSIILGNPSTGCVILDFFTRKLLHWSLLARMKKRRMGDPGLPADDSSDARGTG